jgi:hypothetical protein
MTYKDIKSFKDFIRWIFFIEKPQKAVTIPVIKVKVKTKKKKKKGAKKS